MKSWINDLSVKKKDEILFRLINGSDPHLGNELRRQFQTSLSREKIQNIEIKEPRSTIDLLQNAETFAKERQQRMAERKAKEKARKEREAAIAREKYLNSLAKQQDKIWKKVHALIVAKKSKDYDEAVQLLIDLKDAGKKNNTITDFKTRLEKIKETHNRKYSLLSRIDSAGL